VRHLFWTGKSEVAIMPGNDEQSKYWNGPGGRTWRDMQAVVDQMLKPLTDLLVETASTPAVSRVLDVGCGPGGTTLALARRLRAKGSVTGIDISEPLITMALERARTEDAPATFVRADAQTHQFEPATYDAVISRFGVMFFDDPVRAFANLRRAARAGAELRFIAWRSPAENPFMTEAERAAAPLLLNIPPREPGAPGPFALQDRQRISSILEQAGWTDIDIRPLDVSCTFPEEELARYFTRLGPVGRIFPELDEKSRTQLIATLRPAFEPYVHGTEVRFTASCWNASASAGARAG